MYCDRASIDPGIMLGFACAPENEIEKLVLKMDQAIRTFMKE